MSPTPLLLLLLLCGTCYCSCPDSWTPYGGSCYTVIKQPLTWTDAAARCVINGGKLVEINDLTENTYVWSKVAGLNLANAWIGLQQQGQWVWPTGAPLTFTNWAFGEPNNQNGNESAAAIGSGGLWHAWYPSRLFPSVCERT